ncbi:MAG: AmmeMemoRadiSam system protein B [Candidatus Omnitrophica bacterium]|nr:AmmeMemoRadiSam system protein B [Candidatus Omnitrophota bacterium]
MLRESVASGKFYPSSAAAIRKQINSLLPKERAQKSSAIAAMLPHAGYIYSGEVAVSVIAQLEIRKNIILLGPNHTGIGKRVSISSKGKWNTPMGDVEINEEIAKAFLSNSEILEEDISAHVYEHCLEVELPILQYFSSDFKIVPIVVGQISLSEILKLAADLVKTIKTADLVDETLFLASSDMTHYESQQEANSKDKLAISQIEKLSAKGLIEIVSKNNISMCGVYPTAVVIEAARILGAKKAELIKYETSAKASGDYSQVVGYAGLIIK